MAEAPTLRPRRAMEIVDLTVNLAKAHFAQFFAIALVGYLPVIILRVVGVMTGDNAYRIYALLAAAILGPFVTGTMYAAASDAYLHGSVDASAAFQRARKRWGSVFSGSIVKGFAAGFGLVLLIVPGVYVLLSWFAMPAACVIEDIGYAEAQKRSKALSEGNRGHILAAGLMVWIVALLLVIAVSFAATFAFGPRASDVLNEVLTSLILPFTALLTVVLYYDLRIKKEGFDIEYAAQRTGGVKAGGGLPQSAPGAGIPR